MTDSKSCPGGLIKNSLEPLSYVLDDKMRIIQIQTSIAAYRKQRKTDAMTGDGWIARRSHEDKYMLRVTILNNVTIDTK